ncbi:MAG TPA: GNAT family N-acetyltransferase [Candidatus Limnocylindria bacterium]|nr:GNAT family N-acetyltransferase [Candidatus Limnocylindria bacterium]
MTLWDGTVVTTTERLTLRTFLRTDLPSYAALNRDPEVVKYLGGPLTRADSDDIAAYANDLHAREGIGLLAVERTADRTFLGMCGIHHLDWYPEDVEVGWRLAREHWGRGYATEAAKAWLWIAFEQLGEPRVISVTDLPNTRSIAVMRRLGMTYDHEADLEEEGTTFHAVIHAVTRDGWLASQGRAGA